MSWGEMSGDESSLKISWLRNYMVRTIARGRNVTSENVMGRDVRLSVRGPKIYGC